MKYEYQIKELRGDVAPLNDLGEKGWELVAIIQRGARAQAYLQREKPLIETFGQTENPIIEKFRPARPEAVARLGNEAESMVSPSDPTFPSSSEGPVFRSRSEPKPKPRGRPKGSKNKAKS